MPNDSGMLEGKDRVQRIWRREGLRVPQKQPNDRVFGFMMGHVSGSGRNSQATSGASTLLRLQPMLVAVSG